MKKGIKLLTLLGTVLSLSACNSTNQVSTPGTHSESVTTTSGNTTSTSSSTETNHSTDSQNDTVSNTSSTTEGSTQSSESHGNEGSTSLENAPTYTKDTDFSTIKSDRVTKEEWEKAFSKEKLSNFTAYSNLRLTEFKLDGNKSKIEMSNPSNTNEKIVIEGYIEDEYGCTYQNYMGQEQKIVATLEDKRMYGLVEFYTGWQLITPDFSSFYDKFTYNEEKGVYEYTAEIYDVDHAICTNSTFESHGARYDHVEVKFTNGYLIEYSSESREVEGDGYRTYNQMSAVYYDYGNTSIEVWHEEPTMYDHFASMGTVVVEANITNGSGQVPSSTIYIQGGQAYYGDKSSQVNVETFVPYAIVLATENDNPFVKQADGTYKADSITVASLDQTFTNVVVTLTNGIVTKLTANTVVSGENNALEFVFSQHNDDSVVIPGNNPGNNDSQDNNESYDQGAKLVEQFPDIASIFEFDNVTITTSVLDPNNEETILSSFVTYVDGNNCIRNENESLYPIDAEIALFEIEALSTFLGDFVVLYTYDGFTMARARNVQINYPDAQVTYIQASLGIMDGKLVFVTVDYVVNFDGNETVTSLNIELSNYGYTTLPSEN